MEAPEAAMAARLLVDLHLRRHTFLFPPADVAEPLVAGAGAAEWPVDSSRAEFKSCKRHQKVMVCFEKDHDKVF